MTKNTAQNSTTALQVVERTLLWLKVIGALLVSLVYTAVCGLYSLTPRKYRRHEITGKVALVTGGGSGIGRLLIQRLAKHGATVISWDVNEAGNKETVKILEAMGKECLAYTVDLCDRHAIYRAADDIKAKGIKVDILVNNAGIVTGKNFLDSPDELVLKTFEVNTLSHFWTAKAFLPAMLSSNSGHVVTIASMAGKIGVNKLIDYCSSKFAAVGFDESLRVELMVNNYDGVFTTQVCPYYINTGMFDGVKSKILPIMEPEFVADEITEGILLRKQEVTLPFYSNMFVFLKFIINIPSYLRTMQISGSNESMDTFIGRNKPKTN